MPRRWWPASVLLAAQGWMKTAAHFDRRTLASHAAFDGQTDAGDESGGIRAQEDGCAGYLRHLGKPAERRLPDNAGDSRLDVRREPECHDVLRQLHAHLVGDQPRIDAVDAHAIAELAGFRRGDPRHAVHRRFTRRITGD